MLTLAFARAGIKASAFNASLSVWLMWSGHAQEGRLIAMLALACALAALGMAMLLGSGRAP